MADNKSRQIYFKNLGENMNFTFGAKEAFKSKDISVNFEAESIGDILSQFEDFLRGCGFILDGYLDIVDEKQEK